MIKKHYIQILTILALTLSVLTGCDKQAEVNGQAETEAPKTIFDRVIMGTNSVDSPDLYNITDDIQDKEYDIKAITPIGTDEFVVAYKNTDTLVLKIYDIKDGNIIKDSDVELKTGDELSFIEKSNDSYIGVMDKDNNRIYVFDKDLKLLYNAEIDKNCTSLLVCPDYGRIFYTLKNDSSLYSYILDSKVSAVWFTPVQKFKDFKIVDIAEDNNTLITSYNLNGHIMFSTVSIEEQEFNTLNITDCTIQVAGNDYLVFYPGKNDYVKVYNKSMPRVITTFNLDFQVELDNLKAFGGGPYLITSMKQDDNYICRFYNIKEGILAGSLTFDNKINVISDTSLSEDGQTAILSVKGSNTVNYYLWDLSVNDNVLQENGEEFFSN